MNLMFGVKVQPKCGEMARICGGSEISVKVREEPSNVWYGVKTQRKCEKNAGMSDWRADSANGDGQVQKKLRKERSVQVVTNV